MPGAHRAKHVAILLTLAAGAFAAPTHKNNVLILIQPAIAGPSVEQQNYWKPEQILWPTAVGPGNGGRLLSVSSGANWVGDAEAFHSRNFNELEKQGYFQARKAMLGNTRTALLVGSSGVASSNALVLALNGDSRDVKPYKVRDAWPVGSLMVAEARSWDEEKSFRSATSGRVLVVEYPPRVDRPWTRFWLDGEGWPSLPTAITNRARPIADTSLDSVMAPEDPDLPVPGLVKARLLVKLVTHPESFRWVRVDQRSWPGAGQFLQLGHSAYLWAQAAWILLIAAVLIWSASEVIHERSSRVLPLVLSTLLLSPAIAALAGLAGRYLGLDDWPIWLLLCAYLLTAFSAMVGTILSKRLSRSHPLAPVFAVGFLTLCLVDPTWSLMTQVFGSRVWYVSPVGIAALFGYLTGFVSCIHGCGTAWNWVGRLACVGFVAGGLAAKAWWTADLGATIMIPIFAWLIGEGRFRWPMLFALLVWPTSLVPLLVGGVVWSPGGLLVNGRDIAGLNVFDHVEFLLSPTLYVFLLVGGGIALFGYRFFFHQLSVLKRMDARRTALPQASACAGAFGLLHPIFLYGALALAVGGLSTMLFDAVQTM